MKHYCNNSLAYQSEKLVVLDPASNEAKAILHPTFEFAIGHKSRPLKGARTYHSTHAITVCKWGRVAGHYSRRKEEEDRCVRKQRT